MKDHDEGVVFKERVHDGSFRVISQDTLETGEPSVIRTILSENLTEAEADEWVRILTDPIAMIRLAKETEMLDGTMGTA